MNWFDIVILIIVCFSAVVSLFRGFFREAFSLAAWLVAAWVGWTFRDAMAGLLVDLIAVPSIRVLVAFAILFLITLLVGALVNHALLQLIQKSGLSGTDRLLGLFFGIARGVLIVSVLILLGRSTLVVNDPWWRQSQLIGYFDQIADELVGLYQRNIQNVTTESP